MKRRKSFSAGDVDEFLQTGAGLIGNAGDSNPTLRDRRIGTRVGAYQLNSVIGSGGMGTVYLGQRVDGSYEQSVAVKFLTSVDSSTEARFATERSVLGRLAHPNIARILDAGAHEGELYLVMEFVDGDPIDVYCDRSMMTVRDRIRLFIDVIAAVQFAHGQLIIHRDIKPSNILVSSDRTVTLLDFGIAKVLSDHDSEPTITSSFLTPKFASPEQVLGDPIGTASDVYQLGLLLHLLLTGHHAQEMQTASVAAVKEVVVDRRPVDPSRLLESTRRKDEITTGRIAEARGVPFERLRKTLAGDLDTIVLKCLRKDPQQRYSTVGELSDDLTAWLEHRPVAARRPSNVYRMRRFVRRHRLGVSAAALVTLSLIGGLAIAVTQTRVAENEASRSAAVTEFLIKLLEGSDPDVAQGELLTVRAMLDDAAGRVNADFQSQPEIQATLQALVGRLYSRLGKYDQALESLARSEQTRARLLGPAAPPTLESRLYRARAMFAKGDHRNAELIAAQLVDQFSATLGETHLQTANALATLGDIQLEAGKHDEAAQTHQRALSIRQTQSNTAAVADSLISLAHLYRQRTQFEQAEEFYQRAVDLLRAEAGGARMDLASALGDLGALYVQFGQNEKAKTFLDESLAMTQQLVGPRHVATAAALKNLGSHYSYSRNYEQSERYFRQAIDIWRETGGDTHPSIAGALNNLAVVRFFQERYGDAAELYEQAMVIDRKVYGPDHPSIVSAEGYQAYAWHLAGDPRAEAAYRRSLVRIANVRGPDHLHVSHMHHDLGRLLLETDRPEEALVHLAKGESMRAEIWGDIKDGQPLMLAESRIYLGAAHMRTGDLEAAARWLSLGREERQRRWSDDDPRHHDSDLYWAEWLHRSGRTAEATALLANASVAIQRNKPSQHWLHRLLKDVKSHITDGA